MPCIQLPYGVITVLHTVIIRPFCSLAELCGSIFGSLGNLEQATGASLDEFFDIADANKSGKVCRRTSLSVELQSERKADFGAVFVLFVLQVSFAELVAVFVLEEMRSPELRQWVEAQQMVDEAVDEAAAEISEADAALKIQSGFRGTQARKEVADKKQHEREADAHAKYESWRGPPEVGEG